MYHIFDTIFMSLYRHTYYFFLYFACIYAT